MFFCGVQSVFISKATEINEPIEPTVVEVKTEQRLGAGVSVVAVSITPVHMMTNTFPQHAFNLIMKYRKQCGNLRTEKMDRTAKSLLGE